MNELYKVAKGICKNYGFNPKKKWVNELIKKSGFYDRHKIVWRKRK